MSVSPSVIDDGSVNLLTNPGAEVNTAGWVTHVPAGFTATLTRDTSVLVSGSGAFRLDVTANTAAVNAICGFRTPGFEIPATRVIRLAGSLRTSNPNLVPYMAVEGSTESGGVFVGSRGEPAPTAPAAADTWRTVSTVNDGPPTTLVRSPWAQLAGWVIVYVFVRSLATGATGSVWADDLHLGVIRQLPGFLRIGSPHIGPLRAGKA